MKNTLKSVNADLALFGMIAIRQGHGEFEILLDAHHARLFNPYPEQYYRGVRRGIYCKICECNSLREVVGFTRGVLQAKLLIKSGLPLENKFAK